MSCSNRLFKSLLVAWACERVQLMEVSADDKRHTSFLLESSTVPINQAEEEDAHAGNIETRHDSTGPQRHISSLVETSSDENRELSTVPINQAEEEDASAEDMEACHGSTESQRHTSSPLEISLDENHEPSEVTENQAEEEDAPVEHMTIGDTFSNYESIRSLLPESHQQYFGILNCQPDELFVPPVFTEPETVEAMQRLGYLPEDLTVVSHLSYDSMDPGLRNKVFLELDKCRRQMIQNVIEERNRILNGELPPEGPPAPDASRKRKRCQ